MAIVETVENPRYIRTPFSDVWVLEVTINGRPYWLPFEQHALGQGLTQIRHQGPPEGPDGPAEEFVAVLPADPEDGRPRPEELIGASPDTRLLRLARRFHFDDREGRLRLGPVEGWQ